MHVFENNGKPEHISKDKFYEKRCGHQKGGKKCRYLISYNYNIKKNTKQLMDCNGQKYTVEI